MTPDLEALFSARRAAHAALFVVAAFVIVSVLTLVGVLPR